VGTAARSDRTPLTREFGLPLYQQLHHLLRHRILTGQYAPGSKIPSESELVPGLVRQPRHGPRGAPRAGSRGHAGEGHGKGTFVAKDTPHRIQTVKYTGFLEDLQERVLKLTVTDVDMRPVLPLPTSRTHSECNRSGADSDRAVASHRQRAVFLHGQLSAG
jgi:DNA-binding transcriptional regulator YhcF (GntR family)